MKPTLFHRMLALVLVAAMVAEPFNGIEYRLAHIANRFSILDIRSAMPCLFSSQALAPKATMSGVSGSATAKVDRLLAAVTVAMLIHPHPDFGILASKAAAGFAHAWSAMHHLLAVLAHPGFLAVAAGAPSPKKDIKKGPPDRLKLRAELLRELANGTALEAERLLQEAMLDKPEYRTTGEHLRWVVEANLGRSPQEGDVVAVWGEAGPPRLGWNHIPKLGAAFVSMYDDGLNVIIPNAEDFSLKRCVIFTAHEIAQYRLGPQGNDILQWIRALKTPPWQHVKDSPMAAGKTQLDGRGLVQLSKSGTLLIAFRELLANVNRFEFRQNRRGESEILISQGARYPLPNDSLYSFKETKGLNIFLTEEAYAYLQNVLKFNEWNGETSDGMRWHIRNAGSARRAKSTGASEAGSVPLEFFVGLLLLGSMAGLLYAVSSEFWHAGIFHLSAWLAHLWQVIHHWGVILFPLVLMARGSQTRPVLVERQVPRIAGGSGPHDPADLAERRSRISEAIQALRALDLVYGEAIEAIDRGDHLGDSAKKVSDSYRGQDQEIREMNNDLANALYGAALLPTGASRLRTYMEQERVQLAFIIRGFEIWPPEAPLPVVKDMASLDWRPILEKGKSAPPAAAVELRPARMSDMESVIAVWRKAFPPKPGELWNEGEIRNTFLRVTRDTAQGLILLAVQIGRVVGVAMGSLEHAGHFLLHTAGVLPEFRGRGIFRTLVHDHIRQLMARTDVQHLEMEAQSPAAEKVVSEVGLRHEGTSDRGFRMLRWHRSNPVGGTPARAA